MSEIWVAKNGLRFCIIDGEQELLDGTIDHSNIIENGFSDIIIPLPLAVWIDARGVAIKGIGEGGNSGQRSAIFRDEIVTQRHRSGSITMETLLNWSGRADYMKLDIEGAEHIVLSRTPISVMQRVDYLDFDIHDIQDERFFKKNGNSFRTIEYLAHCGFKMPDMVQGHIGMHRGGS